MKIKGSSESSWVTIVKSDKDVVKAKLLAASLKRVLTSYQIIALCEGSHQAEGWREELASSEFDLVLSTNVKESLPNSDDSDHLVVSAIRNATNDVKLHNCKRLGFLPVDSIVLRNCDQLLTVDQQEQNGLSVSSNSSNGTGNRDCLLAKKLERCLVLTPGKSEGEEWNVTRAPSPVIHLLCSSKNGKNQDHLENCLENIPPVVRLPNLCEKTLPAVLATTTGLWEKKILNYWKNLHDNLSSPIDNHCDDDTDKFTWLAEPVAVVGTAHACDTITLAAKSVFAQCGLQPTKITPSNFFLFIASADPRSLSDFTQGVKDALPFSSNLECIVCDGSTLSTTWQKLQDTCSIPNVTCLVFYKDNVDKISVLTLKRVSKAVENWDKIQAILGPCSMSPLEARLNGNGSSDSPTDITPKTIAEVVQCLNLRGPAGNFPGVKFTRLCDAHKEESGVIPQFGGSHSLVISLCYAEQVQSNYPVWSLNDLSFERPLHCVALQGGNPTGLDKMAENLQTFMTANLQGNNNCNFADLAYTLNTNMVSSSWENPERGSRGVIIAQDVAEARKLLDTKGYLKEASSKMDTRSSSLQQQHKLCFMFTGQGAQYPGMAQTLYKHSPVFRLSLDRCNVLFRQLYNIDIHDVIFKNSTELSRTLYSQTSIFCVEYALLQTWKSWGIQPDFVVGHSLGEFCAAVCAGALELEDALKLVAERSRLIDDLPRGKMLVLRADQNKIQELLDDFTWENPGSWLDFAAINSKDQTVLSGDSRWIEKFSTYASQKNVRSIVLEATHAFHSRHMDPMLAKYRKVAEACQGDGVPKECVYISGVDGRVLRGAMKADYWVRHTREPVRFVQASKVLWDQGCRIFVECGPQPILTALAKVNMTGLGGGPMPPVFLPSIRRGIDDWKTILNTLAQLWIQGVREVDWWGFDKFYGRKFISEGQEVFNN